MSKYLGKSNRTPKTIAVIAQASDMKEIELPNPPEHPETKPVIYPPETNAPKSVEEMPEHSENFLKAWVVINWPDSRLTSGVKLFLDFSRTKHTAQLVREEHGFNWHQNNVDLQTEAVANTMMNLDQGEKLFGGYVEWLDLEGQNGKRAFGSQVP